MNVKIGTEALIFLFWEYLFHIFSILSLLCPSPYYGMGMGAQSFIDCHPCKRAWGMKLQRPPSLDYSLGHEASYTAIPQLRPGCKKLQRMPSPDYGLGHEASKNSIPRLRLGHKATQTAIADFCLGHKASLDCHPQITAWGRSFIPQSKNYSLGYEAL